MGRKHRKRKKSPQIVDLGQGGEKAVQKLVRHLEKRGVPKHRIQAVYEDGATTIHREMLVLRTTPVTFGIAFDEVVFSKWVEHMLGRFRPMPWDNLMTSCSTYVPEARNTIHDNFLEYGKHDWLFMLDSDVMVPPGTIEKFLALARGNPEIRVVGGWYRKKAEPFRPVVYDGPKEVRDGIPIYKERDEPGTGVEAVDAAGAGCWFMHRSVVEALGKSPYNLNEGGEDLLICRKIHDAGFKTWIDWDTKCAHVGVGLA